MRSRLRSSAAALLTVGTAIVVLWITERPAWAGDVTTCPPAAGNDYCIGSHTQTRPTRPTGTARPTGSSSQPAECGWSTVTEAEARPFVSDPPPVGVAVVWQAWCIDAANPGGSFGGPYRWVVADAPPTPAEIAAGLYQQIEGRMPYPMVATNPPLGVPSVVEVPVFVSVTNWQPTISVSDSLTGIPVTVTATPQLLFEPGEPGSGTKACTGPGRRYEPGGGDLWEQAAASGACTHVYLQRTGADGRPDEWPGVVTVRWSITWSAADGSGGSFPYVDRTTAVPRAVEEVQTVVVSGG